jgi:hypothetical protein
MISGGGYSLQSSDHAAYGGAGSLVGEAGAENGTFGAEDECGGVTVEENESAAARP